MTSDLKYFAEKISKEGNIYFIGWQCLFPPFDRQLCGKYDM